MSFMDKVRNGEEWDAFREGFDAVKEKVHDAYLELFTEAGRDAAESGEDIDEAFEETIGELED